MDQEIRRRLEADGFIFEDFSEEESGYLAWFNANILGLDSEEYRRRFWREFHRTAHTIGPVPRTLDTLLREQPHAAMRTSLLFWILVVQCGIYPFWLLRRVVALRLRQLRRSDYYPRERERRRLLAAARREVRVRRTTNPQPTLESIRELHGEIRRTRGKPSGTTPALAALRLGALLEDLERYVDNHVLVKPGGRGFRGRAGGIKRLLEHEAPDLFDHYKSIMRYKALAKRYRQACGADDPIPPDALLPAGEHEAERTAVGGIDFPRRAHLADAGDLSVWMYEHGNTAYLRTQTWAGRADRVYSPKDVLGAGSLERAAAILNECGGSLVALRKAISLRIDPECVPSDTRPMASDARMAETPRKTAAAG